MNQEIQVDCTTKTQENQVKSSQTEQNIVAMLGQCPAEIQREYDQQCATMQADGTLDNEAAQQKAFDAVVRPWLDKNNTNDDSLKNKPQTMATSRREPIWGNIPDELKQNPQWVCWLPDKTPMNPKQPGIGAKSNDPDTWGTFEQAKEAFLQHPELAGVGFMFKHGYIGIDIDDCFDETGKLSNEASKVTKTMNSYTEKSPSGKGLHILFKGKKPAAKCRTGHYEMYDHARYFTVTGDRMNNTPPSIESRLEEGRQFYWQHIEPKQPPAKPDQPQEVSAQPIETPNALVQTIDAPKAQQQTSKPQTESAVDLSDDELIQKAMQAKNGQVFQALWAGDTTGYPSSSEADLALCSLLAFWSGRDAARVDVLFRKSGLFREKWDERHGDKTYGQITIDKAIASVPKTYSVQQCEPDELVAPAPKPTVKPFPAHVLPAVLQTFVSEVANCIQSPLDYCGVALLAVIATVVGNRWRIKVKDGWEESAAIYAGCAGDVGSGKTPSVSKAIKLLMPVVRQLKQEHNEAKAQYQAELVRYEQEKEERKRSNTSIVDLQKPELPAEHNVYTSDTTVEAMAELLSDNPAGILLYRDEITGWINGLNQYKGGKGADREFYLSSWSNTPYPIKRKGKETIHLDAPYVCVVGGLVPDKMAVLKGRDIDGFMERILVSFPDPVVKEKDTEDRKINLKTTDAAKEIILQLFEETRQQANQNVAHMESQSPNQSVDTGRSDSQPTMQVSELQPTIIEVEPHAKNVFFNWTYQNEQETLAVEFNSTLKGVWNKMPAQALRFALLLTRLESVATTDKKVDRCNEKTMKNAIELAEYFKNHARKVYGFLEESIEERQANAITGWAHKKGINKSTIRDLVRSGVHGCRNAKIARKLVEEMVALQLARWTSGKRTEFEVCQGPEQNVG